MTVAEILSDVKFGVNPKGKKSAVVMDLGVWEQIITLLENADELKQARNIREDQIPWNVAKRN